MPDVALVFWVALDLFLVAVLLVVVGGTIALCHTGPRQFGRARLAPPRMSLALYAVGFASGLALALTATVVQTCRVLGVLPLQMPAATARLVPPLVLSAVVLSALSLTLGLVLEWRAGRRPSAG